MNSKKKATELIFNLQWRSRPDSGSEKSNVIGMYDTPITTSNFEMFKSYLLKNSGVAANDVKVTYITDSGQEWVVDSQEWFEIALSAFRLKARLGEAIFLKLDKVITRKNSNVNVETQSDHSGPSSMDTPPEWFLNYMKQFKREIVDEVTFGISSVLMANSTKCKVIKEVVPPLPQASTSTSSVSVKKVKDPARRNRRLHLTLAETADRIEKTSWKALANERKLDLKLDRLEVKTKKLKEKKQALGTKEADKCSLEGLERLDMYKLADHLWEKYQVTRTIDGSPLLDATVVSLHDDNPHAPMNGGEVYLHSWNVMNNGQITWSPDTELRMAWGSEELKPSVKSIRCPRLKPGEKGSITVCFQVPKKVGRYETHWNFYLGYIRFGRTLNCTVTVGAPFSPMCDVFAAKPKTELKHCGTDPMRFYPKKEAAEPQVEVEPFATGKRGAFGGWIVPKKGTRRTSLADLVPDCYIEGAMDLSKFKPFKMNPDTNVDQEKPTPSPEKLPMTYGIKETELLVDLNHGEIKTEKLKEDDVKEVKVEEGLVEAKSEPNPNEDNNNNETLINNNSCEESISEVASVASDLSSGYDVLNVPECDEKEDASGYVYITIDGNKLPVPKYILRPDIVATAEQAPGPLNSEDEDKDISGASTPELKFRTPQKLASPVPTYEGATNIDDLLVACDTNEEPNSGGRLFIFPQSNPGFEVVDPINATTESGTGPEEAAGGNYTWAESQTRYTLEDVQKRRGNVLLENGLFLKAEAADDGSGTIIYKHIPNYQQTPPNARASVLKSEKTPASPPVQQPKTVQPDQSPVQGVPVHILPENLVSGAVNVASSAINTARSVINMITSPKPDAGKWVNGHWVTENQESPRAKNLRILREMGFWNEDLNATLLARYNDDLARVISELVS